MTALKYLLMFVVFAVAEYYMTMDACTSFGLEATRWTFGTVALVGGVLTTAFGVYTSKTPKNPEVCP